MTHLYNVIVNGTLFLTCRCSNHLLDMSNCSQIKMALFIAKHWLQASSPRIWEVIQATNNTPVIVKRTYFKRGALTKFDSGKNGQTVLGWHHPLHVLLTCWDIYCTDVIFTWFNVYFWHYLKEIYLWNPTASFINTSGICKV